jgi:hypothetical protein
MDSKYIYIVNPVSGRRVQVRGPTGQRVLRTYLEQQGSGCVVKTGKRKGKTTTNCVWKPHEPTADECYCISDKKNKKKCKTKIDGKIRKHDLNNSNVNSGNCEEKVVVTPAPTGPPSHPAGSAPVPYIFNPEAGTIEIRGAGAAGRIVTMDSAEGQAIISETGYTPPEELTEEEMHLAEEEFLELDDTVIPLRITVRDPRQVPVQTFLETDENFFKRHAKWEEAGRTVLRIPRRKPGDFEMMSLRQLQKKHRGSVPHHVRNNHLKYFMAFRHGVSLKNLRLENPSRRAEKRKFFKHKKTLLGLKSEHARNMNSQKLLPEVKYLRQHLLRGVVPRLDWESLLPTIREFINDNWRLIVRNESLRRLFDSFYRNLPQTQINVYLAMRHVLLLGWKDSRGRTGVFPVANHPDEPILWELMRLTRIDPGLPVASPQERSTKTHGGLNSVHGVAMCTVDSPNRQFHICPNCIYNEEDDECPDESRMTVTSFTRRDQMAPWATGEQVAVQQTKTQQLARNKKRMAECRNHALHISRTLLRIPPALGQEFFVEPVKFPVRQVAVAGHGPGIYATEAVAVSEGVFSERVGVAPEETEEQAAARQKRLGKWRSNFIIGQEDVVNVPVTELSQIIPIGQAPPHPFFRRRQQGTDFSGRRARRLELIRRRALAWDSRHDDEPILNLDLESLEEHNERITHMKEADEAAREEAEEAEEAEREEAERQRIEAEGWMDVEGEYMEPESDEEDSDEEEGNMWDVLDDEGEEEDEEEDEEELRGLSRAELRATRSRRTQQDKDSRKERNRARKFRRGGR